MAETKIPAIGIDLGTTYSCVAVCIEDRVEIIANTHGHRTTPSYAAFYDDEWLVGEQAKSLVAVDPENTIFNTKRLIGRNYHDPIIQEDLSNLPYQVVNDGNLPKIQIRAQYGTSEGYYPEQISAKIVKKMKETAENFLGTKVTDAVLTVPAFFDNAQREATRLAGQMAGLNVLRILNEPTAAALAYVYGAHVKGSQKILVFDFGGGTLDVSILQVTNGTTFTVLTTHGDMHLGGEDIDQILVDYIINVFHQQEGIDLTNHPVAIQRLRKACEEAKRALSESASTRIMIECIYQQINLEMKLTREKMESLCDDIFRRAMFPVKHALVLAKLLAPDIQQVVLTGGSSRIPKVQQCLKDFFPGVPLQKSINPDEAIAIGAALQANFLSKESEKLITLREGIPYSLGLATGYANYVSVCLPKGTRYPVRTSQKFTTSYDNQESVGFFVYEGERPMAADNHLLDRFEINKVRRLPAGEACFEAVFQIDADGILSVRAIDLLTRQEKEVKIAKTSRVPSEKQKDVCDELQINRVSDDEIRENIEAMEAFSNYIRRVTKSARNNPKLQRALMVNAAGVTRWMEENKRSVFDKEIYVEKLRQAKSILDPYL